MLTDKMLGNKAGAVLEVSRDKIDQIAIKVLKRDIPYFLLPINTLNIDGKMEIRYELNGNRLSYFNEKMMKKDYINLLKGLLLPYKQCGDWFLNYHNLHLDKHYIMYTNKNGYDIRYVYIPIQEELHSEEEIKKFLQEIMINIEVIDDASYPMKLLRILMSDNVSFSELLDKIDEENNKNVLENKKTGVINEIPKMVEVKNDFFQETNSPQNIRIGNKEEKKEEEDHNQKSSVKSKWGIFDSNKEKKSLSEDKKALGKKEETDKNSIQKPGDVSYGSEFGKAEVGGDIMGNLFGNNVEAPKKQKKDKKAKKNVKENENPGTGKESGLLSGLFGNKKAAKDVGNSKNEEIHKNNISNQEVPVPIIMPEVNRQEKKEIFQEEVRNQYDMEDDSTQIFEEEMESIKNDDMVILRLEESDGFQISPLIEINLSKGYATIGRCDKSGKGICDFNFSSAMSFISRTHLRIEKVGNEIKMIDLNSTNGTFLNGKEMVANVAYTVSSGDLIMFSSKRRIIYRMV